jgi:hypothetical protein
LVFYAFGFDSFKRFRPLGLDIPAPIFLALRNANSALLELGYQDLALRAWIYFMIYSY